MGVVLVEGFLRLARVKEGRRESHRFGGLLKKTPSCYTLHCHALLYPFWGLPAAFCVQGSEANERGDRKRDAGRPSWGGSPGLCVFLGPGIDIISFPRICHPNCKLGAIRVSWG